MLIWLAASASAHEAAPAAAPSQPLVALDLALLGLLYGLGFARLWARSPRRRPWLRRSGAAFGAAMLALGVALFSPLDALSERLAWAHMLQHLVLMVVAAPLMVLAGPTRVIAPWGLPSWLRPPLARLQRTVRGAYIFWQPLVAWALYTVTLWVWHLPGLYEAALLTPWLHDVQHLAFVLAATLFWRVVLDPVARHRLSPALGVVYLFAASLQAMMLGVLMTLAPRPWYPAYATRGAPLSLLDDQQLAGALMWMPGCVLYAVVASLILVAWLREPGPIHPGNP